MPSFTSRYRTCLGCELHDTEWGPPQGEVVVTVPGCGRAPALNTPAQFALVQQFFNGGRLCRAGAGG